MKKFMVISILLPILIAHIADAQPKANSEDTPPHDILAEYIRSLSAVHKIQQSAVNESEGDGDDPLKSLMNGIRTSTRLKLQLNLSIGMLENMRLKRKPFDGLLENTIWIYKEKVKLYDEALKMSKMFVDASPKAGVDYAKMTARMPEIMAEIEFLGESLFKSMVIFCGVLIDEKPDSEGNMSHLNISSTQRQSLIDRLDSEFDESLKNKTMNYTVASAGFLKTFLQGRHKSTDGWKQNN